MSPTTARRLLLLALVLATLAAGGFLSGCTPTGYWVKDHEPLPAFHSPQDSYDAMLKACGWEHCQRPACILFGCAQRLYQFGVCIVYTERWAPDWIVNHERTHCAGWSHPGTTLLLESDPPG